MKNREMSDLSLREMQAASGAVFAAEFPTTVPAASEYSAPPVHFGNPAAEQAGAISSAALIDLSNRVQIEIAGKDRVKFLHNFCTNDIKALTVGTGCEAFVTNVKGRVLGHIFVFAGENSLWMESVPGSEAPLLAHLDRYILNEDVQLHPRTGEFGELYISGPRAAEHVSKLLAIAGDLPRLGHADGRISGAAVAVRRVDFTLAPGFLLSIARPHLAMLWQSLKDAGIPPAGSLAFEALRIEAGTPWYGIDLTDDNLAQEAGRTAQVISFKKGCYLGQEPIARIDALGHVNQELRGLRLDGSALPKIGSVVLSPADQKEIGLITSAALSFTDNHPVALASLRNQFTKPGTVVLVAIAEAGATIPAKVYWPANA